MSEIGSILQTLYYLTDERAKQPVTGSYTNYLLDKGEDRILAKTQEQCNSMILACKNADQQQIAEEGADLLYHMTVLLYQHGLTWNSIAAVLEDRREHGA